MVFIDFESWIACASSWVIPELRFIQIFSEILGNFEDFLAPVQKNIQNQKIHLKFKS